MKSKVYTSPLAKRILLVLGLVVLLLSAASQTQAKSPGSVPGKPIIAVVYIGDHPGMNINNDGELKARLLHAIARNARLNPKAVKLTTEGCGCAVGAPQGATGFGSCLRSCMADAGVSAYSLIMCGAACAAAETGIGAIVCAICVGVTITVVQVCALGCATKGGKGFGEMEARAIKHRHAPLGSLPAKLRLQPVRS